MSLFELACAAIVFVFGLAIVTTVVRFSFTVVVKLAEAVFYIAAIGLAVYVMVIILKIMLDMIGAMQFLA